MKNIQIILVVIFTSCTLHAQQKIFNTKNQLQKIVDSNKKELGDWKYEYTDSFDSIYVIHYDVFTNKEKNGSWEAYYTTGKLHSKGAYKNNKKDGYWERNSKDNTLLEAGNYENGLKTGAWYFYNTYGFQLVEKSHFLSDTLHGKYETYYDNGNLEKKGNYYKGHKEGKWFFYYKNGNVDKEITYVHRKKHGKYNSYHENGVPFLTGQYDMGKKIGVWTYHDSDNILGNTRLYQDSVLEEKWFYNNGRISRIIHRAFSKIIEEDCSIYKELEDCPLSLNGLYTEYYEEGPIFLQYHYKKGSKEGDYIRYHLNGNISEKGYYSKDLKQHEWRYYYENGKLQEKGPFVNSYEDGKWEYYFENGNLHYQGEYKKGRKEGKWIYYDVDNPKEIQEIETYSNGYQIDGPKPSVAPR